LEHEEELKRLTLHALKELGEIAKVLIKRDRPEHWKKGQCPKNTILNDI
jgi:hypothetical protein